MILIYLFWHQVSASQLSHLLLSSTLKYQVLPLWSITSCSGSGSYLSETLHPDWHPDLWDISSPSCFCNLSDPWPTVFVPGLISLIHSFLSCNQFSPLEPLTTCSGHVWSYCCDQLRPTVVPLITHLIRYPGPELLDLLLTVLVPGLISMIPILLSGLNFWLLSRETRPSYLLFWMCSVLLLWSVASTVLIFLMYWFQVLTSCILFWYQVLLPLVYFVSRYQVLTCLNSCSGSIPNLLIFCYQVFFPPSDLLLTVAVPGFEPLIFYLLFSHRVLLLCLSTGSRPALRHTFSSLSHF